MTMATTAGSTLDRDARNRYTRVVQALEQGPMHMKQLSDATGINYTELSPFVGRLVREKRLIVVGTAEQAGMEGVKRHARMFALAGTQKLPQLDPQAPPVPKRKRSSAGSGVIAGPIVVGRRMMQHWGR